MMQMHIISMGFVEINVLRGRENKSLALSSFFFQLRYPEMIYVGIGDKKTLIPVQF